MVKIERRGQILEIHEDALAQHEANGWRQVASEQAEQPEADAPRRGRRPQVASEQAEQPEADAPRRGRRPQVASEQAE